MCDSKNYKFFAKCTKFEVHNMWGKMTDQTDWSLGCVTTNYAESMCGWIIYHLLKISVHHSQCQHLFCIYFTLASSFTVYKSRTLYQTIYFHHKMQANIAFIWEQHNKLHKLSLCAVSLSNEWITLHMEIWGKKRDFSGKFLKL